MSQYEDLANCYDEFTTDVNYPKWKEFYKKLFALHNTEVESILDLGCGTGLEPFRVAYPRRFFDDNDIWILMEDIDALYMPRFPLHAAHSTLLSIILS